MLAKSTAANSPEPPAWAGSPCSPPPTVAAQGSRAVFLPLLFGTRAKEGVELLSV